MQNIINIERRIEPHEFPLIIREIIGDDTSDKSMIDLCCFKAPMTRDFDFKSRCFVDIQDRIDSVVLESESNSFYQIDVLCDHEIFNRQYDVSFAIDAIEHFDKEDGYKLIQRMESISDTQILFTPVGEMWIHEERKSCPDTHKSGWLPSDIPEYDCIILSDFHGAYDALIFWRTSNADSSFDSVKERIRTLC